MLRLVYLMTSLALTQIAAGNGTLDNNSIPILRLIQINRSWVRQPRCPIPLYHKSNYGEPVVMDIFIMSYNWPHLLIDTTSHCRKEHRGEVELLMQLALVGIWIFFLWFTCSKAIFYLHNRNTDGQYIPSNLSTFYKLMAARYSVYWVNKLWLPFRVVIP